MRARYPSFWTLFMITLLLALLPSPALAQSPGDLDPTFDGDGLVTTDIADAGYSWDTVYAIAIQPDGKILATGFNCCFSILVRYNPDGSLDSSFDSDGKAAPLYDFRSRAIVLQPNGKIIVAGSGGGLTLVRYNPNGSLDPTFDGDGLVFTSFVSAFALALQPDGKIVAAGTTGEDFAIARYNPDGSPDSSFDDNGRLVTNIRGDYLDGANAVVIQPNGKIVAAGFSGVIKDFYDSHYLLPDAAMVRYNPNGSLDPTFDGDGRLVTARDRIYGLALQPGGKILAASKVLARYNPNGSQDLTFAGDGTANFGFNDSAQAMVLQPNGKIIIAGRNTDSNFNASFAVARYFSNGVLDFTFNGDGLVLSPPGVANALALQSDGKIVAAGTNYSDFVLARYLAPLPDLLPFRVYLPRLRYFD